MNLYNTTNIKALPPVEQILPGNYLVVEDTFGTKKLNFNDFVIGPNNTSFYTPLDTRIKTLSTDLNSLSIFYTNIVSQSALYVNENDINNNLIKTLSAQQLVTTKSGYPIETTSYTSFDNTTSTYRVFEGDRTVLLLPVSETYDSQALQIIWKIVSALDKMKLSFDYITGLTPGIAKVYNNKPVIAVVSSTCGYGCGYLGYTGIEWSVQMWDQIKQTFNKSLKFFNNPPYLNSAMPYEFGRNYWFYNRKIEFDGFGTAATGYSVFNRFFIFENIGTSIVDKFRDENGDVGDPDYLTFKKLVESTLVWYQNSNRRFLGSLSTHIVPGINFTISSSANNNNLVTINVDFPVNHNLNTDDKIQITNLTNTAFNVTTTISAIDSNSIAFYVLSGIPNQNGGVQSARIITFPTHKVNFNNNIVMTNGILNVPIASLSAWNSTVTYSKYDVVRKSDNTAAYYSITNNNKNNSLPALSTDPGYDYWCKVDNTTLRPTDVFAAILLDLQTKLGRKFIYSLFKEINLMTDTLTQEQYEEQLVDNLRYFTSTQQQAAIDNFVYAACKAAQTNLIPLFENNYKFPISNTIKATIVNEYRNTFYISDINFL